MAFIKKGAIMTTFVTSHRTADEIFNEYSTTYNNNIATWVDACIEVGTLKESLEYQTQCLYTPLLKDITREALDKIKDDFAKTRDRLLDLQKQIVDYHPELTKGIVDIKKAIEAQSKQDLSGLDIKLQEKAQELAVIAKQHLQTLEYDEKHITLLEGRFAKRLSQDAEARWATFITAYDARILELTPQPKQPGLIARWLGYAYAAATESSDSKQDEKSLADALESSSLRNSHGLNGTETQGSLNASTSQSLLLQITLPETPVDSSKCATSALSESKLTTPKAPRSADDHDDSDLSLTSVVQEAKGGSESSSFLQSDAANLKSGASSPHGNNKTVHAGKGKHNKGRS